MKPLEMGASSPDDVSLEDDDLHAFIVERWHVAQTVARLGGGLAADVHLVDPETRWRAAGAAVRLGVTICKKKEKKIRELIFDNGDDGDESMKLVRENKEVKQDDATLPRSSSLSSSAEADATKTSTTDLAAAVNLLRVVDTATADDDATGASSGVVDDGSLEAKVRRFLPACRALPKVELHAHLNGCVRDATLLDCARFRALLDEDTAVAAAEAEAGVSETVSEDNRKGNKGGGNSHNHRDSDQDQDRDEVSKAVFGGAGSGVTPGGDEAWTMDDVRAMLRKPDGTGARPLQQCFDLFGAIHHLCTAGSHTHTYTHA